MPAPIGTLADVEAIWKGPEVLSQVERALGRGIEAASIFLVARIKEYVSVPAPRANVIDPYDNKRRVIATVKAVAGDPPRKLTGDYRRKFTYQMSSNRLASRVGVNDVRARILEQGGVVTPKQKQFLRFLEAVASSGGKRKYTARSVFAKRVTIKPHPHLLVTAQRQMPNLLRIIGGEAQLKS